MPPCRRSWLAVALSLICATADADTDSNCPLPRARPFVTADTAPPDPDAPLEVRARKVTTERDGVTELDGLVELIRGDERLNADHLRYDQSTQNVSAQGQVRYRNELGDEIETENLELQVDTRVGTTGISRYHLRNDSARGDAARIEFLGPDRTRITDLRYTTCREGQDDWFLNIGRLDLDNQEEIGTARHATVDFFGVPIFYFPYLNFTIADQRKSGFLFPSVGRSDNHGYEVAAPYYFNLAPNYDATVKPQILTRRGLQLENEFRYLTSDGSGTLHGDILPNDDVTGDDRTLGAYRHKHSFSPLWSANIDYRHVSDKQYFNDFGDHLSLTAQTHLPQTAELAYRGPSWAFVSRLSDHQTIDPVIAPIDEPYARLPQLQLLSVTQPLPNRLHPQLDAEWNRFRHELRLTGERLNLNTGVSLPMQNEWGFVTPKIGGRYIGYRLDRENDDSPALARGVFSLDSGVTFERDTTWGDNATVHTLEPRLFYLRIPAKYQDTLPNFDSGVPDLSFAALFRENRFNGGDRIGDANQMTAAITTRFLDLDRGVERLRLSIGRIYYFDDLEVNLPPAVLTPDSSDVVAEASVWLISNWHARDTVQWDTAEGHVERNNFYLQYQPARNKIFTFGHLSIREQLAQIDVSAEWPVAGRWSVRGRSLSSLKDDRNIEAYLGVEYNACCWALRATASRRWQDPEQVNSISLELQLNGLSKIGSAPESPLKQGLFFAHEDERKNRLLE